MRPFRFWHLPLMLLLVLAGPALAQDAVPQHRYLFERDVDFYGGDLTNLFDTTQGACERACSAQAECAAFTYNTRSNACFPKSDVSETTPYAGAVSARKVATDGQVLRAASERAATLDFLSADDLKRARGFVAQNTRRYGFSGETIEDLSRAMAQAEQAGNRRTALFWAGKAAALSDRADVWTRYARIALAHAETQDRSDRRKLQSEALLAGVNAYLRTDAPAQQAEALVGMAQALEKLRRGRAMIPALRLALDHAPRDDIETALDDAIGKYGFRIVEHRVDNDAAAPRICADFSEKLVQVGVDYTPFVRIDGRGLAVEADGASVCIDGVSHGARYDVTFRQGLPSASGETLHKDVRLRLYVRDRTPVVRFPGRAYVLPRSANAALPVETVNVDTLDLRLRRVSDRNLVRAIRESYFGRPLNQYEDERFATDLAQDIWTGTGEVTNDLNMDMTTRLPMAEALNGQAPGIFALSAQVPGQDPYEYPAATQWFVLSDLGLSTMTGTDGMHVNVRGLSDVRARPEVKLTLISRANAVLGRVITDETGFARFPAGVTRGSGVAAPALLMAEDGLTDVAFLPLTDPAFDLSDRGVEGHPPAPPIDAFLTTDRGAYRAGETVYATALLRDAQARALEGVPLTAVFKRPDGVEHARKLSAEGQAGGHVFALPLGTEVPRGAWRLDIYADTTAAALASQVVLVEDFLPERIDFDITLPDGPLPLRGPAVADVDVRYLFGAPGADLPVEGDVRLRARRELDGWPGYQFGRYDTRFNTRTRAIDPVVTDAQGKVRIAMGLPGIEEHPGQPLSAEVILRVADGSGRPVERRAQAAVESQAPLIGIKPGFDDVLAEGAQARFDLIAVGAQGQATPMPVRWTVNRVQTRYQWYQLFGNWEWEPITRRTRVDTGEVMLSADPVPVSAPAEWGAYEIVVERVGAPYAASSVEYYAGWYGGDGKTDTPDRLEVSLDKQTYQTGDPVTLRVVPEADGVALISVLSNRVIERKVVEVTAGENLIPLVVTPDWGAGAYVTASVIRGMDVAAGQNPARSLGLAHAKVDPGAKALSATLDAPAEVDGQAGSLRMAVNVEGIAPGETAFVTLAAVDVGILNLTGFEPPDPSDHYFGQRRLGVELRDIYGRLIDGLNGAMGSVRSGGDAAASAQVQSPPPTEKLMAFFAGPVAVGADGRAEFEVTKPAFNGTIRLMAVVWSMGAIGNATADVIARDPVVVSAALPRFMAPGDQSRLLFEFVHASGQTGDMPLEVRADGGLILGDVPSAVTVTRDGTTRVSVPVQADQIGDHQIDVALQTPDGRRLQKTLTLPVRRNDPETAVTRQFTLGPGSAFTFDNEVFAGLYPGTGSATLTAGPLARFDVPGLMRQLDRYPYGCTEQVTSGALPLLYLSSVAQASGLGAPAQIDDRIDRSIARVLARQTSNGAFGLWRAQSGEFWLDAYVTDFLSRARAQGHVVPDRAFGLAMDNLRNRISYAPDFDKGGADLAYALMVLAREGAASMADLRYYADTKAGNFSTPLAVAQLGAALALYGDPLRADALFRRAGQMLQRQSDTRAWRADFGTPLRDTAAVLKLSAEVGSTALSPASLTDGVRQSSRRLSTQEAAQVVLAAHAMATPNAVPGIMVDGAAATGPMVRRLVDGDGAVSVIENVSEADTNVTLTTYGVPQVPPPAGGYGYAITRTYFTMEGMPVEGPIKSGDRFVTVIKVSPFEKIGARLIVDDPLPAGLEIDNPNLIRSGDIAGLDWLETTAAETAQFRSDRFIAAVNHRGTKPFQLAYVVRAVSPGEYHHPAALVEDMYRPEYRATTDTRRLTVLP